VLDPLALDQLATQLTSGPGVRTAAIPVALDPLDFVRAGSPVFGDAFYFAAPDGRRIGALGTARRFLAAGIDRFRKLGAESGQLPAGFPLLLGAAFTADGPRAPEWNGFPAAALVLPAAAIDVTPDGTFLRIAIADGADPADLIDALRHLNPPPPPLLPESSDHAVESRPAPAEWRDQAAQAVGAIRAGAMRKVVLSRAVTVTTDVAPEPFDVVYSLAATYPECYPFGWRSGDGTFVGASPELLVARMGDMVTANPLAGSAPRGEGEDDDRAYGDSLMTSRKDRVEHAFVVDDVASRLDPFVRSLDVPPVPSLRKMATVQHLSTEIVGTVREPAPHVLDLVEALHPTPAVGGTPRDEALAFIDKIESTERGWYAGGIGWVDAAGNGQIALALRCGMLRGSTAYLYAGAGIVADSDPEQELRETRLKFKPLLDLLTAS
jgi:isochorismate synthase